MPNITVPANATALPAANLGERVPHVQSGSMPTQLSGPFLDFAADDSGAMQHVIADDPPMDLPSFGSARCHAAQSADTCACGAHVTAFEFMRLNFEPFNIKDLRRTQVDSACAAAAHVTTNDLHEAFLVAFKALIAAPWPVSCTRMGSTAALRSEDTPTVSI